MRAKRLARDGAYRKAVSSLTSSVADLTPAQQKDWATKLLPRSERPDAAIAIQQVANESDPCQRSFRKCLLGVRFAALSAAGSSGVRPEHLRDALTARSHYATVRLFKVLSALIAQGTQGTLPDTCRWILDSRLVFLRKKKDNAPRPVRVGEL